MKRLAGFALACLILLPFNLYAQDAELEDDVGPRVVAEIGIEKPFNADIDQDVLLRWGVGFEWPGVFGYDDVWFVGMFQQVGWGTDAVQTANRWNWGLKGYPSNYWPRANPWLALGVEHEGGGLIVDQRNVTWVGIGIEPETPVGWLQFSWQATGWLMDKENRYRFVIDFIPGAVLD